MSRGVGIGILVVLMLAYGVVIVPFGAYMQNKPVEEKLGYVPSIKILRPLSVDQKQVVSASLVMKVMMYYGGLFQKEEATAVVVPPDFQAMSRVLHAAVKLDPYNMDAYYFAQSFLTWDVRQFTIANNLLKEGMQYRTWDWTLPFYAGFNYAYFLHDYKNAAIYYQKAGQLSGQELHINLAGKYLQESGQTDHAIAYLSLMSRNARSSVAKRSFDERLELFRRIKLIENARDRYAAENGRLPESLQDLTRGGYLGRIPDNPQGGGFQLAPDGTVRVTGKNAAGVSGVQTINKGRKQ